MRDPKSDNREVLPVCPVCGNNKQNKVHVISEMFFGTRERFDYVECVVCGCLSIAAIPAQLGQYYPDDYYSKITQSGARQPTWKRFLKRQRSLYWLGRSNLLGRVLASGKSSPWFTKAAGRLGVGLDDRVLDVGSGSGGLLINMAAEGFTNLTGTDPFITNDIAYANGVTIHKREIAELEPSFDLIMFNHSFEHLADPHGALRHTRRLLATGGGVLIRVPVADSAAWRLYGVNWYQLDAPRHLIIHTRKSIKRLAAGAGLTLMRIDDDSDEVQFWASEAYQRGVPLIEALEEQRSAESLATWRARARELNARGEGDQACFYFTTR
jgi:SAM-dependent methyltransferase